MKKILIGAALLIMGINCPAETKQALTLHMASGAQIVYFLDTEPAISFRGQTMEVTADNKTSDIPMEDVDRWEIGMAEYSGIDAVTPDDTVSIKVYGTTVTVNNPENIEVRIYSVGGQLVGSSSEAAATFSLNRGIYIISLSDKSYKIAIR